jgi:hypothetical protein
VRRPAVLFGLLGALLTAGLLALAATYGVERYRSAQDERRWHALRATPAGGLSAAAVGRRLAELDLFEVYRNPRGHGVRHRYELTAGGRVVLDRATGLAWQRGGSARPLRFAAAEAEVAGLNRAAFAGFADWRLPTLEEAMSLVEPAPRPGGLHVDPLFAPEQWWIWTADRESVVGVWVVYLYGGSCLLHVPVGGSTYVRAVRRPDSREKR